MSTPKVGDIWYRLEDRRYAPPVDEWGDIIGTGRADVEVRKFRVIKITPKGVRVAEAFLDGTFRPITTAESRVILDSSYKRFACPTMALALESYQARKKRQIGIYQARASAAKECLRIALKKYGEQNVVIG